MVSLQAWTSAHVKHASLLPLFPHCWPAQLSDESTPREPAQNHSHHMTYFSLDNAVHGWSMLKCCKNGCHTMSDRYDDMISIVIIETGQNHHHLSGASC